MGRPFDKHIDERELEALASTHANEGEGATRPRPASVCEAERHVALCGDCRRKVSQYRQVMNRTDVSFPAAAPRPDCPTDIDWHDVAAGLWPELKARQLITHAARCAHCGPLLRAAASAEAPTAQEEHFLAQLNPPSRPARSGTSESARVNESSRSWSLEVWRKWMGWKALVPAGALLVLIAVLGTYRRSSSPVSGMEFAQLAASTHEQHLRGSLALELSTDSQSTLNAWLHENTPFSLALPTSSETPQGQLPYSIKGARLIQIRKNTAAYIAYQMQPKDVSLIVAPVSAALASGGIEAAFKKVTFHYYTIQDYKVVTWSVHGLTYALVSAEGNKTQRSCMVCHSAMTDRDLSRTPTPLSDQKKISESFLQ